MPLVSLLASCQLPVASCQRQVLNVVARSIPARPFLTVSDHRGRSPVVRSSPLFFFSFRPSNAHPHPHTSSHVPATHRRALAGVVWCLLVQCAASSCLYLFSCACLSSLFRPLALSRSRARGFTKLVLFVVRFRRHILYFFFSPALVPYPTIPC